MPPPMLSATTLSLLAQIAPAPYYDRFSRVLGSNLGPDYVTQVLGLADQGYLWTLADLLEECRGRDPHLHGDLQRREMRVAGAPWELRPPEGSGPLGKEIAAWCAERLAEIVPESDNGRSFAGVIADLMGAVYHGRAGHELVWRVEPRDGGGEWWSPRAAEWIHPRRFAYATNWSLHIWDASGTGEDAISPVNVDSPFGAFPGVNVRAINRLVPGKFLVHTPRVMGTYPTREGVGRTCAWYTTFKRLGVREYVAFIAWAARGIRLGSFKRGEHGQSDGATTNDELMLREVLANMSAQTAGVFPDTCDVDIKTVPGEGRAQANFIGMCNAELSKAVHGSTLGTEVGSGGGNRALGEVHERNEESNAKNDATQIADTLRLGLLGPMVARSFGAQAPVPQMFFDVVGGEDLDKLARRMKAWSEMGGPIGEKSGANALSIPNLEPGEPLLKNDKRAPVLPDDSTSEEGVA